MGGSGENDDGGAWAGRGPGNGNGRGGAGGGRGQVGRGRGRGRGWGGGRGGGRGRGPGGRGPHGGRMVHRGQQMVRLFHLKTHLVLKCFNFLDDVSRKNSFHVMGWPLDNYLRRQEAMRIHQIKMEQQRQERLKKEEEAKNGESKIDPENSDVSDRTDAVEEGPDMTEVDGNRTENDCGGKDVNESAAGKETMDDPVGKKCDPTAVECSSGLSKIDLSADKTEEDVSGTKPGSELETEEVTVSSDRLTNTDQELHEEIKSIDVKGDNDTDVKTQENPNPEAESSEGEKATVNEAEASNGTKVERGGSSNEGTSSPQKEILPPLFARLDPDTLLSRLNTRRLYQRILYYKRKGRSKLEAEASKLLTETEDKENEVMNEGQNGDTITGMYDQELMIKKTEERVYRKNMTIQEMASKEWKELLEVAELRNGGDRVPYYPIPTQHELLLFSPCPRAVGVLASYPRSGNSLMRTMYEHISLRVTGSDMQGGLAKHDLVGEMAVDTNMVQFVKTHFPERQGTPPFRASRVVLLVRNPFDAIESFFNLMMTGTHTTSISKEVREKTARIWEEYVLREIRVWKRFHLFWMRQDVPTLLIRYEDLIRQPDKVMLRVIPFVLEVKRMDTFFTERITRCIQEQAEIERMGSYKPRSGGIGKSLSKYSPELFAKLLEDEELKDVMGHLGYSDLLVKPSEEWSSLEPLRDHATEFLPSWHNTENKKVVILNRGNLARGPDEVTRWQRIKFELGIAENNCDCEKCRAARNQPNKSSEIKGGEKRACEAAGDNEHDTGTAENGESEKCEATEGQ